MAAVSDDLIHGGLDGVDDAGDVDREQGLDRRRRRGAQCGGARQDAGVGDRDVNPPEAVDDIGDGDRRERRETHTSATMPMAECDDMRAAICGV